jgi:hypothetical protein
MSPSEVQGGVWIVAVRSLQVWHLNLNDAQIMLRKQASFRCGEEFIQGK